MISVALVDDESLFRKGLGLLLQQSSHPIRVAFEAGNGQELLDQLQTTVPDMVILDLNMPQLNGIDTVKILQTTYPDLKVVVLSSHFSKTFILHMLELGADAYLPKDSAPEELVNTILQVAETGFCYNAAVMEAVRDNIARKAISKAAPSFDQTLTPREREILQLICEELTTQEIADQLFISHRTVDGHRNNLLGKLGCRNVAGLVIYAIQHQLVSLDPNLPRKRDMPRE